MMSEELKMKNKSRSNHQHLSSTVPVFAARPLTFIRRDSNQVFDSPNVDNTQCEVENNAAYGPCLASSYQRLELSSLPTAQNSAFPGLPFAVVVTKVDAYNQTIVSDSFSVIQAHSSSNFSMSTSSVATLQGGKALLSFNIKPLMRVNPDKTIAGLAGPPSVYANGIDAQAKSIVDMTSNNYKVIFAEGQDICPVGYILALEQSPSKHYSFASCSICSAGTYSVSPLSGPHPPVPSCFNCPVNAFCSGGDQVRFALGAWVISNGMYTLVGCPAGFELVNSINGAFSHDIQQCVACEVDQYILNTNSSNYTCQDCPVGAICDGNLLRGAVPGSLWLPDPTTGQYVLQSCPAGYVLTNKLSNGLFSYINQACTVCPASYYCPGGAAAAVSCQQGQFAPPGANSSSLCRTVTFLSVLVSLPMTAAGFSSKKQTDFATALAFACGQLMGYVVIQSVQPLSGRRVESGGIQVQSSVVCKDPEEAAAIQSKLDLTILNNELADQGLPACALLSVQVVQPTGSASSARDSQWVLLGSLLAAFAVVLAVGVGYVLWSRTSKSEDELALKREAALLRARLRIRRQDGFLLSSERAPWWTTARFTVIQRTYLEAAAQLGLFRDFDVFQFDAFCLCVECEALDHGNDEQAETAFAATGECGPLMLPGCAAHLDNKGNVECRFHRRMAAEFCCLSMPSCALLVGAQASGSWMLPGTYSNPT